jgi:hypothetical protein
MTDTMRGFRIDRDLLTEEQGGVGIAGYEANAWRDGTPIAEGPVVSFRLFDDDGELYYEGVFGDAEDENGDTQYDAVLNFGEYDAGCTTVKVKRNGAWTQEIG